MSSLGSDSPNESIDSIPAGVRTAVGPAARTPASDHRSTDGDIEGNHTHYDAIIHGFISVLGTVDAAEDAIAVGATGLEAAE